MKIKKGWLKFSLASFTSLALINLVNAQYFWEAGQGSRDLMQLIQDFFGPIFEALLGVPGTMYDQYFFARVLFLILMYIMVSLALDNIDLFKGKKGIIVIISATVAILGARYIGDFQIIQALLLPYGALMISISIILPILIFGFFVHKTMNSGVVRKAAWVFFGIIFVGLWWTRRTDMQFSEFKWIYDIGIWIVVAIFLADSKVHEYFGYAEAREAKNKRIKMQLADIEAQLNKYSTITNPSPTVRDTIRHLELRQKELNKEL
jgi:hypothetical protein